jgi:hypothetical protein
MMIEDLKSWKDNILKMLHENGIKCPCGGSFNDCHSHNSGCVVIKPTIKEVKKRTLPGRKDSCDRKSSDPFYEWDNYGTGE